MDRLEDLRRFYDIIDRLAKKLGGARSLTDCNGRQGWPKRGVYFFYESGEIRLDSGIGPRIVRVGTHALTETSVTSLWGRLAQHRRTAKTMGGNHRTSIFRLLVGEALQRCHLEIPVNSWGNKQTLSHAALSINEPIELLRVKEHPLEVAVSAYIGKMPFLWIEVPDTPGQQNPRSLIERGTIALLSNWNRAPLDPASLTWLGRQSSHIRVQGSGLWNNRHVDEAYDPAFITILEQCVSATVTAA